MSEIQTIFALGLLCGVLGIVIICLDSMLDNANKKLKQAQEELAEAKRELVGYKNCFDYYIKNSHDCNDCSEIKKCEYLPKPGDKTRINCPLWRGKQEG